MAVPLPPSGSNVQRWLLVRLVQFPSTDKFGAALPAEQVSQNSNVRWNTITDFQPEIKAQGGSYSWGEIYNGWCLCLVEAQISTLNDIENDPRSQCIQFPNQTLASTLTTPQRNQLENALLSMGRPQAEINAFGLQGKTVRQIFDWMNVGVHRAFWNGSQIEQTMDFEGFSRSLDSIIDGFNLFKTDPFIDPSPDYGVVDDFNRTDTNTLADDTRWLKDPNSNNDLGIAGNTVTCVTGTDWSISGSVFQGAKFGGNVQMAISRADSDSESDGWSDWLALCFKLSAKALHHPNPGGTVNGYAWKIGMQGSSQTFRFAFTRCTSGTRTDLTPYYDSTFVNGDETFFTALDDTNGTMYGYINGTLRVTTTDSTYKSTLGYTGITWIKQAADRSPTFPRWNSPHYDNFKVGATITEIERWGTAVSDSTVGNVAWTTPNNGRVSDDVRTTTTNIANNQTEYLKLTNSGCVNYPSGTTFQGFMLWTEGLASNSARASISGGTDAGAKLVLSGSIVGDNKTDSTTYATSDSDIPTAGIGGASDLWGTSPTVTDMNASTTGVVVSVACTTGASTTMSMDNVRLRIYSTLPPAFTWYNTQNQPFPIFQPLKVVAY